MKINGTRIMVAVAALMVMFIYVQLPQLVIEAPVSVAAQSVDAGGGGTIETVVYPLTVGELVAVVLAMLSLVGVVATWFRAGGGNIGTLDAAVAAQLSQTNISVLSTFENMFDKMDERHQATLRQVVGVVSTGAEWSPMKFDDALAANMREMTDGVPVKQKQMVTPGGTVGGDTPDPETDTDTKEVRPSDVIAQAVRASNVDAKPSSKPEPGSIGPRPRRQ